MPKSKHPDNHVFEERLADLDNKWKRALADYANLEKRLLKEKDSYAQFANTQLLSRVLEITDDLEKSAAHLKDQGLNLILSKLHKILNDQGVSEIDAPDNGFNPLSMEAVEVVPGPDQKIVEIVSKGYRINNLVLRPMKVKVGRGNPATAGKEVQNG